MYLIMFAPNNTLQKGIYPHQMIQSLSHMGTVGLPPILVFRMVAKCEICKIFLRKDVLLSLIFVYFQTKSIRGEI